MRILNAVTAAIALACLVSTAPVHAADKVTVSYLPTVHGLPLFAAIGEKLFEKEGLEVEATKFENPNQIIDSLVSGRADSAPAGGAAGITALAELKFPGALRVFGLQGSNTKIGARNDALIVKAGSPITSFADLKGKKLAHVPGIQWRTISRTIIQKTGLNPDTDVELVEMAIGLHAQAVTAGTVDAALTLEPVGSIVAASPQIKIVVEDPAAKFIANPFFAGAGIVTTKFLKERPDVARRFIAAMNKAAALVEGDFNTYRKHLVGFTPVTDATISLVKPMHFIGSDAIDDGAVAAYQLFADIFPAGGVAKEKIDVSKIVIKSSELK